MYTINLNDNTVTVEQNGSLIDYLREEARLTSVKNGCGEGACGACMVLVDGKAMKACVLTLEKVNGKRIITVEGLSEKEKDIYSWAFAAAGAVQCGFCIPGMVISAKGLLDKNPDPSAAEIKKALQGNICRCTGYVKIEKAIAMAAKALREGFTPELKPDNYRVGDRMPRVDAVGKTLGTAEYVDDMQVEGMLHGAVLRSKYPRAVVKHIDVSKAQDYSGVVAVLVAKDIPGENLEGHIVHDWPTLVPVGGETRYVGDALAIVAADTRKIAKEAVERIEVEYEVRKPLLSPQEALAEGAPTLNPNFKGNILRHTVVKRGNVEEAIAKAKHVVTQKYTTPFTEHAFLEPESALAVPNQDGTLTVYVGSQNVYDDHAGIIQILGVPEKQVRVVSKMVGGGFGGKEDLSVQHHAALLAWHTKKPVKLTWDRRESIRVHPKRHPAYMDYTVACDEKGMITAVKAEIITDTGAYASLGGPVTERACTHAAGPYQIPNVDLTGIAVYTNNPPCGAFRGFGVPQSSFAMESTINLLAERVGISPWEIRYRNAIEPGGVLPNGQIADEGTALKETLLAVKEAFESNPKAGIACSLKNSGIGVGLSDVGRMRLLVKDGKVMILTGAACIGQGMTTVLTQIVAEATGLNYTKLETGNPDTYTTPDGGTTTASRQTLFTGEAARKAALQLKKDLENHSLEELEGREYYDEFSAVTDPIGADKPNPVSHIAYGYATHVAILNEEGKVAKIVAAHDVGRAINPIGVEGQIDGGVVMGLGYALTEDFPLKDGMPTAKFGTLGLFRAANVPEIEGIIVEKNQVPLAYGAKGIGEIAAIPTAPAVAGAYYRRDGKFRTSLPLADTAYNRKK
ncbi:selenium-dependent xanthine dehydrogenase [Desulfotomaculum sp. 1211_IL3151]|uniref:selenium-dependent xanthine dehydrogenase n=1 Tax=Desulfotomaculum sp. 1211_IL3151 TaxID=3084055 RepID=UPI002FD9BAA6